SASMRSILSKNVLEESLKLTLGLKALGSLRFLPIVNLINGENSQNFLQQAKAKDAVFKQKLWHCEETKWWSYFTETQHDRTAD
ncbi:IucA/IucC family protein, partial [Acinetobacter baumannii]|uniref:IucA/IucC family protein n=1 Tax=Acinetobacter baumannii TaxID=470 RepID=UPI000AE9E33B